jgi:hypothetical protein
MGRCASATRTPRTRGGRPGPCPPMRAAGAFGRRWCPRGATQSATRGCGVLSIVPSCTSSSAASRGTPPPPLRPLPNQRRLRPLPGARPSARGTCVPPAVRAYGSGVVPCPASNGGHQERPSDLPPGSLQARPHASCRRVQAPGASVSGEPSCAQRSSPPHGPQDPPHSRVSRPSLTAADHGPASHAPSQMLPTRFRLHYHSRGDGARFRSTEFLWRLRATKTLFRWASMN